MAFGTSERPPEDRLARQREIFEAVAPLILTKGTRRLSMIEAADAASMSIDGLYYYFPEKRDLMLHALQPEAISRCCQDFLASYHPLADTDPVAYADRYFEYAVRQMEFFRPAVHAALEMGVNNLWETVTQGIHAGVKDFAQALHRLSPSMPEEGLANMRQALRHELLAAILEKNLGPEELEMRLRSLVAEHTGISTG